MHGIQPISQELGQGRRARAEQYYDKDFLLHAVA
jgi:hypothetical protein